MQYTKRVCVLALLLCLLCGCTAQPVPAATVPADKSETQAAETTVTQAETQAAVTTVTQAETQAAETLYRDYLTGGGYAALLAGLDEDTTNWQIESLLADVNEDGVPELLVHITDKTYAGVRGFPSVSALLGVRDGQVERLGVAYYGGGSGGGDYLFVRYDTKEKKHVLEYEEFVRDGMFYSTMAHHYFDVRQRDEDGKQYGLAGEGDVVYAVSHTLRCSSFALEGVYAEDAEKALAETDLAVEADGIVTVYQYDGAYISEAAYNAMRARFTEPTDPAYRMQPVTPEDPIPSA